MTEGGSDGGREEGRKRGKDGRDGGMEGGREGARTARQVAWPQCFVFTAVKTAETGYMQRRLVKVDLIDA